MKHTQWLLHHKRMLLVSAFFLLLLLFYFFNPTHSVLAPKCVFKLLTGYDCPGCGAQRAIFALLHGHLGQAIAYNYFFVVAVPYAFFIILCEWVLRGKWQQRFRHVFESRLALGLYVALYLAWWVVRNVWDW